MARPIPSVGAHVPINCPAPTGGYAKPDSAANGEDANVTTFSPGHGGPHTTTFPAAACNGSVRMVGYDIDADLWAKIRNRRDRAVVNWN